MRRIRRMAWATLLSRFAQGASPEASVTAEGATEDRARASMDAGLGTFAEDGMATLHPSLFAEDLHYRLYVDPRLRFRTLDRGPREGSVRREDWDEPSDFAHVLRELTLRHDSGERRFELRIGEQNQVSIGHGSIVRDYSNAVDPDHLRAGAYMRFDDPWFGLEALVDNYVGPRLVATRLSAHPVHEMLTIAGTMAFDLYAPVTVQQELDGSRAIDDMRNLETNDRTLTMVGGDAEVRLEDGSVALTPYVDVNALVGLGMGLHTGAQVELGRAQRVLLRGEYTLSSDSYLPAYAGTLYDLTRLQHRLAAPVTDPPTQRSDADAGGFQGHGFASALRVELRHVQAGVEFSRHPGIEGNWLALRLEMSMRDLVFAGRYLHRAIGQTPGSSGVIVIAGVRWLLAPSWYATADYMHLPRLSEAGLYEPIHIATAGLGATFGF